MKNNITSKINQHMTHAEDLVILGGNGGIDWIISMFKILYGAILMKGDILDTNLSIKFDGAPSVLAWASFPGLNNQGIAIKSLFAKTPKLLFTEQDIDNYYSDQEDLAYKLKSLLKCLPELTLPENQIWQGDFLFDDKTISIEDGHYVFHPNTILYKVPIDSKMGRKITGKKMGLVWHTRYVGTSLSDIQASYDIRVSELNDNINLFMIDPYFSLKNTLIDFSEEEDVLIDSLFEKIHKVAENIYNETDYTTILQNTEFLTLFPIFENTLIRSQQKYEDSNEKLEQFKIFVNNRYTNEILKRKTERGKCELTVKRDTFLSFVHDNKQMLCNIINLMYLLTTLKNIFVVKLNSTSDFKTYLKTLDQKYISTGHEGFALSDKNGNIVKLVDRYQFSHANFSSDILKGWNKNKV